MSTVAESVVTFDAGGDTLLGILHLPPASADTGVLILVGGPQYRVGSHRMFVQIARELARAGNAVLRFDFAGMGDSTGSFAGFDRLDRDVRAALDVFQAKCPGIRRWVLFGLCDGASAAACYLHGDTRVAAAALLNPWVHTEAGEAKAFLWHYYPRRLVQADFWRGLLRGQVHIGRSVGDLLAKVGRVLGGRRGAVALSPGGFVERMRSGLAGFSGPLLIAASGNDFTAAEFVNLWTTDGRWQQVRKAARFVPLDGADHTLSARDDLLEFCAAVCDWLRDEGRTQDASGKQAVRCR